MSPSDRSVSARVITNGTKTEMLDIHPHRAPDVAALQLVMIVRGRRFEER
jgi:hypothetical protein